MGTEGVQQLSSPFGDEPCDDIPLQAAPLVRVLCQLRFDQLSILTSNNAADEFATCLSDNYPYMERAVEFNMLVGGGSVAPQATQTPVWRLRSADRLKTVTLINGSISLETSKYLSRDKFIGELSKVAAALQRVARVPSYSRIGFRFTNQIIGDSSLADLPNLVRPEILGISGFKFGSGGSLDHLLSQAAFTVGPGSGLLVQWGNSLQTLGLIRPFSLSLSAHGFLIWTPLSRTPKFLLPL
ncbi:TIGR04255 family protein [Kitasatospora fiedleri]|uniref:TIGR04255 family protein n=1 Tax=Kitasatospora fiedleri TaxID=2991545 RepID=UPI00384E188B